MDRIKETAKLQAHARAAWNNFIEIYPRLVKFDCPRITLNGRFSKAAGMCYMEDNHIALSLKYYIFNQKHIITDTLVHELAHQVDYNLHGLKDMKALQGHGPKWQKIMNDYGLPADRYHTLSIPNMKLSEMLEIHNAK